MKKITSILKIIAPLVLLIPLATIAQVPAPLPEKDTMLRKDTILKKDTLLAEVIVTHRKPLLTYAIDRTIVNVEAMISASTSNALEVLGKTPGVIVEPNGGISLNGQSGVQILINGRPTYLSAQDLAGYLRSIPGSGIEKLELMDNPPARYDASGSAIINIQLKRSNVLGVTGQVSAGYSQGILPKSNQSLNLTYFTPRIRWYNNFGYNTETSQRRDRTRRTYFDDENNPILIQQLNNTQQTESNGYNIQSGVDYTLSAKTTVGAVMQYGGGKNDGQIDFSIEKLPTQFFQDYKRNNLGLNLNFLSKLKPDGRELSGEFNYYKYRTRQRQDMLDFKLDVPADMNVITFNTDYAHPIGDKLKIDLGYKTSVVFNNNEYGYTPIKNQVPDEAEKQLYPFNYRENIQAIYINAQKKWNRLSSQVGLRSEYTFNKGISNEAANTFRNNYLNMFPSLFLSYKLDSAGKNNLTFQASRRINRPNYQSMNPYILYTDRYNYNEGNPQLNPQFLQRYELKYMHKQWFNTALVYSRFDGVIFPVVRVADSVLINRNENVALGQMIQLNTTITLKMARWWNMQSSVRLVHAWLRGKEEHPNLDIGATILRIDTRNDFNFSETLQAEFGWYYGSRDIRVQSFTKPIYWFYGNIQKKIWNKKASIRLSFEDIFRTSVTRNESVGLDKLQFYQWQAYDSQRIGLAFTYSFGKKGLPKKSRNLEQAGDERSRF